MTFLCNFHACQICKCFVALNKQQQKIIVNYRYPARPLIRSLRKNYALPVSTRKLFISLVSYIVNFINEIVYRRKLINAK